LLLGIAYEDYSIAAKAFRVATLRRFHRPRQRGLLVRARDLLSHPPHGRRVVQVPVSCEDWRASKFNLLHEAFYKYRHLLGLCCATGEVWRDLRRRCGEAGAPSSLRFGAARREASTGRCARTPHRRCDGAPASPLRSWIRLPDESRVNGPAALLVALEVDLLVHDVEWPPLDLVDASGSGTRRSRRA